MILMTMLMKIVINESFNANLAPLQVKEAPMIHLGGLNTALNQIDPLHRTTPPNFRPTSFQTPFHLKNPKSQKLFNKQSKKIPDIQVPIHFQSNHQAALRIQASLLH
jgi:hypothetical protein